jgi:hypothetical protein
MLYTQSSNTIQQSVGELCLATSSRVSFGGIGAGVACAGGSGFAMTSLVSSADAAAGAAGIGMEICYSTTAP